MNLNNFDKKQDLYKKLDELKEAREFLKTAIHHNFYNRLATDRLYEKFKDVNRKIEKVRYLIKKEQLKDEKSREKI